MKPADSEAAFIAFAMDHGVDILHCTVREGFEQMIAFKRDVAAEGVEAEDGDVLMYQWGTFDWGDGPHFLVELTRQFVEAGVPEDDAISQLSLTFRFPATPQYENLGEGNRWFDQGESLQETEAEVRSHPGFVAVNSERAADVIVRHDYV